MSARSGVEIAPFAGLSYEAGKIGGELSKVIAPPYDVLDANDKAALLRQHDRNIVAVDLPFVPPKSAGPDAVYQQAAATLHQWREDGTLKCELRPAIYVYHQQYTHGGRSFVRKKFFARMRLEPFGAGGVFPHEQTFGGPKEDRRKLMIATRCQLSPIFGLYSDPQNAVSGALDVSSRPPDVAAEMDGVLNRLWVVTDPEVSQRVAAAMAARPVYIADGHHRYSTALAYRDELIASKGELAQDHPARFVFAGFCAMEDPGCVILPTHRILSGFGAATPEQVLAALQAGLETQPAESKNFELQEIIPAGSPADVGIFVASGDRLYTGRFTRRAVLDQLAPERSPAWRQLDLAYLHRYLIDECLTRNLPGGQAPTIAYLKDARASVEEARRTNGIAILTRPCTMEQLRAVSHAGDLMPQKSTYFYPKLATGLVLYPLE